MISTVILNPKTGDTIQSGQDFQITLQVRGLQAGAFTNAFATYYSAPQALNGQGFVIGHTHVTVQDIGNSLNPTQPPDPTQFAFFKGINDNGNGQGLLAADVEGGLPPGNYRVCTLTSGSNHQPVIMPVAQRGSQDDCTKFTVVGNDFDINDAANNGEGGLDAAAQAEEAVQLGAGALTATAEGAAATADAQDNNQEQNNNNNQGQQDNNNQGQQNNNNQGQQNNNNQGQQNNNNQGQQNNNNQGQQNNNNQGQQNNNNQGQQNNNNQGQQNNNNQGQQNNNNQGQQNNNNQGQQNNNNQGQQNNNNQGGQQSQADQNRQIAEQQRAEVERQRQQAEQERQQNQQQAAQQNVSTFNK
jgi:transcription initiation factor TFIID subunit 15